MGQLIQGEFRMPPEDAPSVLRRQVIEAGERYEDESERASRYVFAATVVVGCSFAGAAIVALATVLGWMS